MANPIMMEKCPGTSCLAYGYEAVARGALEAGIKLAAGFPGTPGSGALKALASVSTTANIHVEWATNEKVAYEVAWGAAKNGQRAFCSMNHLGVSVLMDPLKLSVNQGIKGGLVLFVGDDIGANTSAYESDSRIPAHSADMPVLTPTTLEEARTLTKYAFELSEALGAPVMLRSVCQLLMTRSLVSVGEIDSTAREIGFKPSPNRKPPYGPLIRLPVVNHRYEHTILERANQLVMDKGLYQIEHLEGAEEGIVCAGVCYSLVQEALSRISTDKKLALLKMNVANPFSEEVVGAFLAPLKKVLVLEEGESFIEERVLALAAKLHKDVVVIGRTSKDIPISGELFVGDVQKLIIKAFLDGKAPDGGDVTEGSMPYQGERPLALCGGCGHMSLFSALRKAMQEYNGGKYEAIADAGCAFMCSIPPAKSLTANADMGGSIAMATGAYFSGMDTPLFAITGDGGFFHGGLNGLANAIYNRAQVCIIIADNGTFGNTGLQTTASTGQGASGNEATCVDIASVCRAMGAPYVKKVDPYHFAETKQAILELLEAPKPAVLVAEQACVLNRQKDEARRNIVHPALHVDTAKCNSCGACMELYCSAISWPGRTGSPKIHSNICSNCGVCQEVCPQRAIIIDKGV